MTGSADEALATVVVQRLRNRFRHVALARSARTVALGALDVAEGLTGRRDPMRPPRRLQSVGDGDFRAVGEAVLRQLVDIGGLTRDARVLDAGCGTGRTAIPLTGYLSGGSYEGFDISAPAIIWCQRAVTPSHPTFTFRLLDIANSHYNRDGQLDASTVRFPYADNSFDFALATSLFTHMVPASLMNYVAELGRVLAPRGTFFGTFFLLNEQSKRALDDGMATIEFPVAIRDPSVDVDCRVMDARSPETAVAIAESSVTAALQQAGFEAIRVRHGRWWAGAAGLSYQDVVVARRAG